MVEQAFKVKRDSDFYNKYFAAKDEREKFHQLAKDFLSANNLDPQKYCLTQTLRMSLTEQEREWLGSQIRKYEDENGLWVFLKKSPMQKAWEKDVTSQINHSLIDFLKFWYLPYIMHGSYALWDYNRDIYGVLTDRGATEIKLGEDFVPIKMSEYYAAREEAEEDDAKSN